MRTDRSNTIVMNKFIIISFTAILVLLVGCTTGLRNKQLEKVAKDWSLVIRASQIIPVYPLSEDLQPGDVLLVNAPIEEQVAIYKDKGFLPIDQHMVRLYSSEYKKFYNSRYGITDDSIPPAQWQRPTDNENHNWKMAPRAAFPTYQFSVKTGMGMNLAIPIQGIPFSLGLMNSGSASGTVTIADAYSFGLDIFTLEKLVRKWGKQHRRLLNSYEPSNGKYHFLRVVSRVYITGSVSVTLKNDEATGAESAAGADRPLNLLAHKEGSTVENYSEVMKAINKFAKEQLPGAKVKIATASSRSVTLNEEFDRPLVIGYIGFDLPILKGGRLGAAISTLAQLTETSTLPVSTVNNVYRLAALSFMYQALKEIQGNKAIAVRAELDTLDGLLPDQYPFSLYEFASPTELQRDSDIVTGKVIAPQGFQTVLDFLGHAQSTVETLQGFQHNDQLKKEYQSARDALTVIEDRLSSEPALMEAIDFVFLGD